MTTRHASHAGSWYTSNKAHLSAQLDQWLSHVPPTARGIGAESSKEDPFPLPCPGARVIIAPHAGYSYSGPAAAWAYKSLDLSDAKRIFLLGPSHHVHLTGCALSQCDHYATPLGNLALDKSTIATLHASNLFDRMSASTDEAEHSLEMHLPYLHAVLSRHFGPAARLPPLIPILVGATSPRAERRYGALLAPYLADPTSVFVVSSDFCHWGARFRYTYYEPAAAPPRHLRPAQPDPDDPPIWASIERVDLRCVDAVERGGYEGFLEVLAQTGNTVCGRHPIGVVMCAMEKLAQEEGGMDGGKGRGRFRFVRYERSSECVSVRDSSVSYCSAFAVM